MRTCRVALLALALLAARPVAPTASLTTAGRPARLTIAPVGSGSLRVTLAPRDLPALPDNPAVAMSRRPAALALTRLGAPVRTVIGGLRVEVRPNPTTVVVTAADGRVVQRLAFQADGRLVFDLDGSPVLGLGEGGPRPLPGTPWREQPVQFDRRGQLDTMEPRWQSDMYGSRNPAPVLFGTGGWGLFVASPWVQVDLRDGAKGAFLPVALDGRTAPQSEKNQQASLGKGLPPAASAVSGLWDLFVFDAHDPAAALKNFAAVTGPAAMPPRWALGYMQSHRTLEDERQLLAVVDTFREKRLPLDAVIYLGTGFAPRGWNTEQPSLAFNPDVFRRDPKAVLADLHARHVEVVLHVVPWDRDRLPALRGDIPSGGGGQTGSSPLLDYWREHVPLLDAGVDGFWPDEGDWFDLHERLARHRLYYQGPLWSRPDVRPWHLQRNGFPGIARWGGWVWSGDTESSWKTLEAQVAVGLNYSVSIGPFWGSDIGGFYPNSELTGELYARWFQFAAFCGSFRGHGRVWWTRLPWGWGLDEAGPPEYGNRNAAIPPDDPRRIRPSELHNAAIEPVARRYAELRYQLLPYTYTLAREARDTGLPLMRPMWVHYPDDARARVLGGQYLWGRDILVAPVFTQGATAREVYLPAGTWYDWWTGERQVGGRSVRRAVDLATMPIYVRAGAIIPVDPVRQYTGEAVTEPTTLRIYTGAPGRFVLYDDDGTSQQYVENRGTWTAVSWDDRDRRVTLAPAAPRNAVNLRARRVFRILLLPEGRSREVVFDGATLSTVTLQ
jgi:alpha-glucosidase (family GH31 glycosyl hydrolase)